MLIYEFLLREKEKDGERERVKDRGRDKIRFWVLPFCSLGLPMKILSSSFLCILTSHTHKHTYVCIPYKYNIK